MKLKEGFTEKYLAAQKASLRLIAENGCDIVADNNNVPFRDGYAFALAQLRVEIEKERWRVGHPLAEEEIIVLIDNEMVNA